MQITGDNIKLKLDYSVNETKALGIVDCQCGRKVIINEVIQDTSFDFANEKANADTINSAVGNPIIPDSVITQEKLDKAIILIDYLLANGMFNASVIDKAMSETKALGSASINQTLCGGN